MKKNILFVLIFFVPILIFSFDGGGLFKTGIGFNINKSNESLSKEIITLKHFDSFSLWMHDSIDKHGKYNFSAQGSYFFRLSTQLTPKNDNKFLKHIFDIDLFKFSFDLSSEDSNVYLDLGRFGISDITKIIFDQNLDGLFVSYKNTKFDAYVSLGLTGLLNSHTNPINDESDWQKRKYYSLASNYFVFTGLFSLPVGKFQHIINLEMDSFVKLNKMREFKNYFTFLMNGPIFSNLFFILSSTGELRYKSNKISGGIFVNADMFYFFSKYNSKLGIKTQWFSGENFYFDSFTLTNASNMFFSLYKDLWKNSLYASIKPLPELSLQTHFNCYFFSKILQDKKFYKGFEWDASISYIILSDLLFSFDGGVFIDDKRNINSMFGMKGTISF